MKFFKNFIVPCFISFLICFSMLFLVMSYTFVTKKSDYETVQKTESSIPYLGDTTKSIYIEISIEKCPIDFLITLSPKYQNVSVIYIKNFTDRENTIKNIAFNLCGFENMVNFLGGIEIETPYGLPSPYKNKTMLTKNEKLLAFGSSIGEIFTKETAPTLEMKEYYCYILEELCIKFLKNCTPESYKFLKQNCETDISYTEFYDNFKSLKNIKR